MEWNLSPERFEQYNSFLQSAQETEANVGSLTYKIFQLNNMREEINQSLKAWWEEVIVEMKLDPKHNFMISRDGLVQDVTPKTTEPVPSQGPATEKTVEDLK